MHAFSLHSIALLGETLAWGCLLPGRLNSEKSVGVNVGHLILALLTCEGPGKDLLARLGITLETGASQAVISLLVYQAKVELDRLPAAREYAKSLEISPAFSSLPFNSCEEEAQRMGSEMIDPIHFILAFAKRGHIPIPHDLLCSVLDSSGSVKSPEVLGQDLARMERNLADLQDRRDRWASVVAGLRESLALNQATLSSIEKERAFLASCMAWMQRMQQAPTPIA